VLLLMGKADEWALKKEDLKKVQINCNDETWDRFNKAKQIWAGKKEQIGNPTRNMDFLNHLLDLNERS